MTDLLIRNVRPQGGDSVDLLIRDGRIAQIATREDPLEDVEPGLPEIDGRSRIALPGFVDAHAHLDKTTWGRPYRPHSAGPGLAGLVDNERANRGELGPVADRAAALLQVYAANGTTLVRSHVDIDTDAGLGSIEGVLEARDRLAGQVDVEIVAFPQSGLLIRPGTAELLDQALASGADVIGGIDPAGLDGEPIAHLDVVFELAQKHGKPIDIHLHDRGELGAWEIERIVERTRATGLTGRVTISHAFALATVPEPRAAGLIEKLAATDIAIATAVPAGGNMLPVGALLDAGVRLGAGNDGVRDLWSPWGTGDMLERARLLAWRSGYRFDHDIERAVEVATVGGARVLGIGDHGLFAGARADVVLLDGESVADVAARPPANRTVVKAGRVL